MPEPKIVLLDPFETFRGGLLTPSDVFVVTTVTSITRNANGKITQLVLAGGGLTQTVTIGRDGSDKITAITATQPT